MLFANEMLLCARRCTWESSFSLPRPARVSTCGSIESTSPRPRSAVYLHRATSSRAFRHTGASRAYFGETTLSRIPPSKAVSGYLNRALPTDYFLLRHYSSENLAASSCHGSFRSKRSCCHSTGDFRVVARMKRGTPIDTSLITIAIPSLSLTSLLIRQPSACLFGDVRTRRAPVATFSPSAGRWW